MPVGESARASKPLSGKPRNVSQYRCVSIPCAIIDTEHYDALVHTVGLLDMYVIISHPPRL